MFIAEALFHSALVLYVLFQVYFKVPAVLTPPALSKVAIQAPTPLLAKPLQLLTAISALQAQFQTTQGGLKFKEFSQG